MLTQYCDDQSAMERCNITRSDITFCTGKGIGIDILGDGVSARMNECLVSRNRVENSTRQGMMLESHDRVENLTVSYNHLLNNTNGLEIRADRELSNLDAGFNTIVGNTHTGIYLRSGGGPVEVSFNNTADHNNISIGNLLRSDLSISVRCIFMYISLPGSISLIRISLSWEYK